MCCIVPNNTIDLCHKSNAMLPQSLFIKIILFLFLSVTGLQVAAQSKTGNDALAREILQMDSLLFNALNTQNVEVMKSIFDKNLEFYHDKGGLTNYDQNIKAFTENFTADKKIRRELVAGSTEVYPVPNYGAIQIGTHTFCHPENGRQDCGTFKFVHIWKKTPEGWKLARVVSYDH
jgi:hypothetical protein